MFRSLFFLVLLDTIFVFCHPQYQYYGYQGYDHYFPDYSSGLQPSSEIVQVRVYYESLCPGCQKEFVEQLRPLVRAIGDSVDLEVFPYGHAKTTVGPNGYEFSCQHGPPECYGNKLHACSIYAFNNITQSVDFNACLMEGEDRKGSDDAALARCAQRFGIDGEVIRQCANSQLGSELLKQAGDATALVKPKFVPLALINDKKAESSNIFQEVCDAFTVPPPGCRQAALYTKEEEKDGK